MLALVFLLYETLLTLGGIATTLFRLFVTRKHLLQWTSYADTVRVFAGGVTWQQMLATILSAGALAALILLFNPAALFVAMPLLIAGCFRREIAYWISRPIRPRARCRFPPKSANGCAAWLGAPGSFLSSSSDPKITGCPRTIFRKRRAGSSRTAPPPPTWACCSLSTLAAYDLGYIGLWDLSARLRRHL